MLGGGEFHGVFIPMNEPRCNNTNNEQINDRFGTIFELYPPLGPGNRFRAVLHRSLP